MKQGFKIGGIFNVKCIGPDGVVKWEDEAKNLIPNTGLTDILDVVFSGSTPTTTWYIGLKNAGTVAAADTSSSHAGWTENSNYTGNRQAFVEPGAATQSITNSASVASFPITVDTQTIAGAFMDSAATGTAGLLISAADFTGGNKAADNGDTLEVTYTVSATST
jgi:hypothetical protein